MTAKYRKSWFCLMAYISWVFILTLNEVWGCVKNDDLIGNIWETTGHTLVFAIVYVLSHGLLNAIKNS